VSIAQDFHQWINAQSWVPGVVNFNVSYPSGEDPWYVMNVTEQEHETLTFCQSDGGSSTVEITGYGSQRYDVFSELETLRENIQNNLRGVIGSSSVWRCLTTGTVSTGTVENQINEYSFEVEISWERRS